MSGPLLEHVSCNICGADEPRVLIPSRRISRESIDPSEFRSSGDEALRDPLVICTQCGLQYVTPRVDSRLALEGYTNAPDQTFVSQAAAREITFRRCLSDVQRVWRKPPGKILDVGTAGGSFLKVAADAGWEVAGCEPNRWLCKWCEDNYGIRLSQGTIFDAHFEAEAFDVVTLWDVLEHTPDPMAALAECVRVLKPGGLLVVNYPDVGSWIARMMGRRWVFLVSVHYYYFTRQTIRIALEKSGLRILRMNPHIQSLNLDYILNRTIPCLGALGKAMRSLAVKTGLGKRPVAYWIGQTLVVAQKPLGE
jgi:2-polyprenyl-3-methyl-5-hydroxy-6-metoxy-1,4-benzoquinol methylase